MAGEFEHHVIPCKWKRRLQGYRLWVKGRPDVFGEADTFEDAEEALTKAIWEAADDLDAVIPTMPVYDPPLPAPAVAERYLQPELYLVSGDGIFELDLPERTGRDDPESRADRKTRVCAQLAGLYSGGFCRACHHGIGRRTEQKARVRCGDTGYDGGYLRVCTGIIGSYGRVYSDRFLALLQREELDRLEFQPVELLAYRGSRKFYELVAEPDATFVGVNGFDAGGWECATCGRRVLAVSEPTLQEPDFALTHFVGRGQLPDPLPSCLVVGDTTHPELCFTRQRWDQLRGQQGVKGIIAEPLGVVPDDNVDPHPRLHQAFRACEACAWPEPLTVTGARRRWWRLPAIDCSAEAYSTQNLEWLGPAQEAGLIQIVRQTISLDQMNDLINHGTKPKRKEFISFRCPDCWRLGRVTLSARELSLDW